MISETALKYIKTKYRYELVHEVLMNFWATSDDLDKHIRKVILQRYHNTFTTYDVPLNFTMETAE